jgi:hypothetical protein
MKMFARGGNKKGRVEVVLRSFHPPFIVESKSTSFDAVSGVVFRWYPQGISS